MQNFVTVRISSKGPGNILRVVFGQVGPRVFLGVEALTKYLGPYIETQKGLGLAVRLSPEVMKLTGLESTAEPCQDGSTQGRLREENNSSAPSPILMKGRAFCLGNDVRE